MQVPIALEDSLERRKIFLAADSFPKPSLCFISLSITVTFSKSQEKEVVIGESKKIDQPLKYIY